MSGIAGGRGHIGGPPNMQRINIRLVNKDLFLPDFPCMAKEPITSFIDKLCQTFTLNRESLRVISNGKLVQFN